MRLQDDGNAVTLWVSARDTEQWGTRIGAAWPCSSLRGHRFCATFDTNGLLDLTVDGRYQTGDDGIDGHEFSACCADMLKGRIAQDHPIYFVAVGQFE